MCRLETAEYIEDYDGSYAADHAGDKRLPLDLEEPVSHADPRIGYLVFGFKYKTT